MDLCTCAHTVTYRKWLTYYGIFNNQSSQEEGMQTFIHKNSRPQYTQSFLIYKCKDTLHKKWWMLEFSLWNTHASYPINKIVKKLPALCYNTWVFETEYIYEVHVCIAVSYAGNFQTQTCLYEAQMTNKIWK